MANPELIDGFDKNDTNTLPVPDFLKNDGYADGQTVEAYEHNELFKQLFAAANKNKNDGVWDWEDPTAPDATSEYNKYSLVRHNGEFFIGLVDLNEVEPVNDGINWKRVITQDVLDAATQSGAKLWQNQATTITPPTDADYTLTATENGYGRFVLDLSNWTQARNIIVDDTERSFIVDSPATNTYTATVKTSAGVGISILPTERVALICDGINVIEATGSPALAGIATPTKTGVTTIVVDGNSLEMSLYVTPTAGLDYYFSKTAITTTIQADTIGGFHYSLVPHAEAPTGNKTEADMVKLRGINEYSIWTLWDRPICFDPRGKAKVGSRWYDIYLMDRDYGIRGYSAPTVHTGANIAAGVANATYFRQIPKIPLAYGGDGTVTYGKYTWFQACEVATATGNQNISYNEFPTIAYGVLEGVDSSAYGDNGTIFHIPQLMSKYGIEMATGTEWIWGADVFSDTSGTYIWQNVTDSRGQAYSIGSSPKAVLLGGARTDGVNAGSRASVWGHSAWDSHWFFGSRFACDSLEHE